MSQEQHLIQIRNGIYLLCAISFMMLITGVLLNLYLNNQAIEEVRSIETETSSQQLLMNELNDLLEANKIDALISRCEEEINEKPLSATGHYYLGLAYYHNENPTKSREHLETAGKIDPTWQNSISPYLESL